MGSLVSLATGLVQKKVISSPFDTFINSRLKLSVCMKDVQEFNG